MSAADGRTERQRMLAGEPYDASDPELMAARARCAGLLRAFNDEPDGGRRSELLRTLLGSVGEGTYVNPPLRCDYGTHITIGKRTFVNFDLVVLDVVPVVLGDDVQVGPPVQLLAADHPRDPVQRQTGVEWGAPIRVEDGAWLGGGVVVCPGVTIGAGSVVGAGAVVVRDVPPGVVAAGNPCRVVRELG